MAKWTKEIVLSEAKKYNTRTEFEKNCRGAYRAALKNGWKDEVCGHMVSTVNTKGHWDIKENVANEAQKYTTRTEFEKNCGGAVNAARRHGWMDDVCSHMKVVGSKVKRAIYALIFPDKQVYVGLSYNPENRLCEHLEKSSNVNVRNAIVEYGLPETVIFDGWFSKEDAGNAEQDKLDHYINLGYTIFNIVKTGGLGGKNGKWTKEQVLTEAKKHNTKGEFRKAANGAYQFARKKGFFNEACSHMVSPQKPKGYWTKERVAEEATKYQSCAEFYKKAGTAYNTAIRNGYLDEVSSHMTRVKRPNGYWTIDRISKEATKYNSRKEFEDGSSGAYDAALSKKCMNEVCAHMA